jgi:hypothetical protein
VIVIRADSLHMVYLYAKDAVSALGSWVQYLASPAERARRAQSDAEWEAFVARQFGRGEIDGETLTVDQRELANGLTQTVGLSEEITEREEVAINAAADVFQNAVIEALGSDDIVMTIQIKRYASSDS